MSRYNDKWDWIDWSEEDEMLEGEEMLDEELYEEEDDIVIDYAYGIDEKYLREKMAPKPVESPAEFSRTPVIKLSDLIKQKIEGLIVGLATPIDRKAEFFYTIKYWWIGKDPQTQKTVKKLVSWEVRGPTSAYFIIIPTEHIIGIYQSRGYSMSSDIFVEYRIDEQKRNLIGQKWVERRDAFATWKKPEQNIEKEFKKIQEGKPSSIAGIPPTATSESSGFTGFIREIQKTLTLIIVLAVIIAGIYFTAKLGLLDIVKDVIKTKK